MGLKRRQVEDRRHQRRPLRGNVTISWLSADGEVSCHGNCVDVSDSGMLVEVPHLILVGTKVVTQIHGSDKRLEASVRHYRQYCGWYRIGLELTSTLRKD